MQIVYCEKCGLKIAQREIDAGTVVFVDENQALCSKCAPLASPKKGSSRATPSASPSGGNAIAGPTDPKKSSRLLEPVGRPSGKSNVPPTAVRSQTNILRAGNKPPPETPKKNPAIIPIVIGAGGMVIGLILILVFSGKSPPPDSKVATTDPSQIPTKVESFKPVATPVEAPSENERSPLPAKAEPIKPPETNKPEVAAPAVPAPVDEKKPAPALAVPPAPVAPAVPVAAQQLAPGSVLTKLMWDKLEGGKDFNFGKPARAVWGKHTPHHSLTGNFDLAATLAGESTLAVVGFPHERPNPCQIAIFMNSKEIFNGNDPATKDWAEHSFLIPADLLKAGRNELRFDCTEDTSVENRAPWLMVHSVEIRAGAPGQSVISATPPAAATTAAATEPIAAGVSLAKVMWNSFKGGGEFRSFNNKGTDGRAIWGKKHGNSEMSATFSVRSGGPAVINAHNYRHPNTGWLCQLSITINGKEIFKGPMPASTPDNWGDHRFVIPDGVLKTGDNEIRIVNLENENDPWYMLNSLEIISTRPLTPEEKMAAAAPKKNLDDDGVIFNPLVAGRVQQFAGKPKAAKGIVVFAGPGFPAKEFEIKSPAKNWSIKPASKELLGARGAPGELLAALPAFLEAEKPEVVVLFGDGAPGRKLTDLERLDWEDAAHLCLRMGAVPILAIPAAGGKDDNADLRNAMTGAAENEQIPGINLKAPEVFRNRLKSVLNLLDAHVYGRETGPVDKEDKKDAE